MEMRFPTNQTLSIVMASFPIGVWKQPRVLDSGGAYIQLIKEPVV